MFVLMLSCLFFSGSVPVQAEEIAPELWVNRSSENWQALENFSRKGTGGRRSAPVARRTSRQGGEQRAGGVVQKNGQSRQRNRPLHRKRVASPGARKHNGLAPPRYADESPFSPKRAFLPRRQAVRSGMGSGSPAGKIPRSSGSRLNGMRVPLGGEIRRQPLPSLETSPSARKRLAVNAVRPAPAAVQIEAGRLKPLGADAWKDISIGQFEKIAARFHFPLASAVSQNLLLRLLVSSPPPRFAQSGKALRFEAGRLDLLLRMGGFRFVEQVTERLEGPTFEELRAVYRALSGFARLEFYKRNCALVDPLTGNRKHLPARLRETAFALKVYCAVRRADLDEASLLMEAAAEQGGGGPQLFDFRFRASGLAHRRRHRRRRQRRRRRRR